MNQTVPFVGTSFVDISFSLGPSTDRVYVRDDQEVYEGSACFLTNLHEQDAPVWPKVEPGEKFTSYSPYGSPFEYQESSPCSVWGFIDGCFTGTGDAGCGTTFVAGRPLKDWQFREQLFLNQRRPSTNHTSLQGVWTRVSLSVDLVSGYVRGYANAGEGPVKVIDEQWFLNAVRLNDDESKPNEPIIGDPDTLLGDYLNPDGSFGLADEMLVATDCFASTKLGGLAIFPSALHESDLQLLTGSPGSPMSYLVEVTPRALFLDEGNRSSAQVTLRLLHRPPGGSITVSVLSDSSRIVLQGNQQVTFHPNNWDTPQQLRVELRNDERMQNQALESSRLRVVTSIPVAWPPSVDDVVHLSMRDDDVAAIILTFTNTAISHNSSNETAAVAPRSVMSFEHRFPLPVQWCREGFICRAKQGEGLRSSIGSVVLELDDVPMVYTIRLGSEPAGAVVVAVVIDAEVDPLFVAEPSELRFEATTWNTEQNVRLLSTQASFNGSIPMTRHTVTHEVRGSDDQYNTIESGVLKFEVIAVLHATIQSNVTTIVENDSKGISTWEIVAMVIGVMSLVTLVSVALFRRFRKKATVRIELVQREATKLRETGLKLQKENDEYKSKLHKATAMIESFMEEGGSALAAYELKFSDITFEEPKRRLGEGSFGSVYHGLFRGEHEVAVKTMRILKVKTAELEKFKGEIVIMAPLKHDNLVRLWGGVWNEGADKLCIVLEFCALGSFRTYLQQSRRMSWAAVRYTLALGTARGLSYLHHELKHPLIHRDIKPDNILVDRGSKAKLADFGESRNFVDDKDSMTMTQVGTMLYCAPEITLGERYNESVDTFSFALVLLSLVVGKINYCKETIQLSNKSSRMAYVLDWRPPIPEIVEKESPELVELIRNMWQKDGSLRPCMKDVVVALLAPTIRDLPELPNGAHSGGLSEGEGAPNESVISCFRDTTEADVSAVSRLGADLLRTCEGWDELPVYIGGEVALLRLYQGHNASGRAAKLLRARERFGSNGRGALIREQRLSLHTLPRADAMRAATWQTNEWLGLDAQGDVIVFERWGAANVTAMLEHMPVDAFADWDAYRFEARAMVFDALSRRAQRVVQFVYLIDLGGAGTHHRKVIPLIKEFTLGEATYVAPNMRSATLFLRSNAQIRSIWNICMHLGVFPKRISETCYVIRESQPFSSPIFHARFVKSAIPADLGGTLKYGDDGHCCLGVELPAAVDEDAQWHRYSGAVRRSSSVFTEYTAGPSTLVDALDMIRDLRGQNRGLRAELAVFKPNEGEIIHH